jgi:sterol desaturase/sphingolipid hydroxylase (fatty acid hydroxylase superfamily)
MQLSKLSYYSDFVVYPIAVAALIAADISYGAEPRGRPWLVDGLSAWLLACLCGAATWTVLEYGLHRVALHFMAYFSPMHALHHADPLGLIGTPSWISVTVWLGVILLPLSFWLGFNIADGATVGIMLGYWWYGIVHHVIHHHAHKSVKNRGSAYFDELRAWHMRHHHSPKQGNFGVTTRIWDHVFGTAISARRKAVISS